MANEFAVNFLESLKAKRRAAGAGNRARTKQGSKQKIIWLFPYSYENSYRKIIEEISINPIKELAFPKIKNMLPSWLSEFKNDNIKLDGFFEDIKELIRNLGIKINNIFGTNEDELESSDVWATLILLGGNILLFNRKQFGKFTKSVLGFEYETDESWWPGVRDAWAQENFRFLKKYGEDFTNSINEIVSRGVRNGTPLRDITRELNESLVKNKNKAKLLARDQVGKLNAQITKYRMQEVGINGYFWQTAVDERVRGRPGGKYPNAIPSHWAMQGMLCKWDDNTVYADPEADINRNENGDIIKINWKKRTGNMLIAIPGEPINCRCTALPFFEPIIKQADDEIE